MSTLKINIPTLPDLGSFADANNTDLQYISQANYVWLQMIEAYKAGGGKLTYSDKTVSDVLPVLETITYRLESIVSGVDAAVSALNSQAATLNTHTLVLQDMVGKVLALGNSASDVADYLDNLSSYITEGDSTTDIVAALEDLREALEDGDSSGVGTILAELKNSAQNHMLDDGTFLMLQKLDRIAQRLEDDDGVNVAQILQELKDYTGLRDASLNINVIRPTDSGEYEESWSMTS